MLLNMISFIGINDVQKQVSECLLPSNSCFLLFHKRAVSKHLNNVKPIFRE